MAPAALSVEDLHFAAEIAAKFPASRAGVEAMFRDALRVVNNQNEPAPRQRSRAQCLTDNQTKFESALHVVPPSYAQETKTDGRDMNTASVVRKFPSTNERITKEQTAERVSFALQAWGKERASPIKVLARLTGVSRKAAEAWWHGKNPPQSDHLFTLARQIPELKSEVARLLDLEQDCDPGFSRELIHLMQKYVR
jgi:transcriptional regulator with XRE-family HTH domain